MIDYLLTKNTLYAMFSYPEIDPVFFSLGPLTVHWYGLMYLFAFVMAYLLSRVRAREPAAAVKLDQVDDLIFYAALGVIVGGRVGYMIFYSPGTLVADPLSIFRIWDGGMSFHGGLIGVLVAMAWHGRQVGRRFFEISDFLAPMVPLGLGAGRIGNFINGELWGKITDSRLGVSVNGEVRHASQLYEAFLEGLVLFAALWWFSAKPRPTMAVSGLFLLLYGVFRFAVEFVRVPDAQYDYLALGWVTMGQVLSTPMILIGTFLMVLAYRARGEADVKQAA